MKRDREISEFLAGLNALALRFSRFGSLKLLIPALLLLASPCLVMAEEPEHKKFEVKVDANLFFINNEFNTLLRGYTLPGFRFTPTFSYNPVPWVKLEGGVYLLRYWGADNYPNDNYIFIPDYSETENSKMFHILPFLRLQGSTPFGLTVVAGNIYGQSSHKLLPQIYATELAQTSDPETGLQLLFKHDMVDLDLWLDWRKFIYRESPSRERFFAGLSSQFYYCKDVKGFDVFSPLQVLVEHRGGEIDTNEEPGINTLLNSAIGVGARYNVNRRGFQSVTAEFDAFMSDQLAGIAWPYDKGWSYFAHVDAKGWGFELSAGFYHASRYISLLGLPLWGVASTETPGMLLQNPSTTYLGLKYEYDFAKYFTVSAYVKWYELLECDMTEGEMKGRQPATHNFSMGVTFTAVPSWKF